MQLFFRLKLGHGRYPAHLHKWGLCDSSLCNRCNYDSEDRNHPYFGGPGQKKLIDDLSSFCFSKSANLFKEIPILKKNQTPLSLCFE